MTRRWELRREGGSTFQIKNTPPTIATIPIRGTASSPGILDCSVCPANLEFRRFSKGSQPSGIYHSFESLGQINSHQIVSNPPTALPRNIQSTVAYSRVRTHRQQLSRFLTFRSPGCYCCWSRIACHILSANRRRHSRACDTPIRIYVICPVRRRKMILVYN